MMLMYVTFSELLAFAMFIIAMIALYILHHLYLKVKS